eukprot:s2256_g1.t1
MNLFVTVHGLIVTSGLACNSALPGQSISLLLQLVATKPAGHVVFCNAVANRCGSDRVGGHNVVPSAEPPWPHGVGRADIGRVTYLFCAANFGKRIRRARQCWNSTPFDPGLMRFLPKKIREQYDDILSTMHRHSRAAQCTASSTNPGR